MDIPNREKLNPWKTLSSKKVYENPWIKVIHNEVKTPAGTDGIYGKVHFKNWAVAVVPLDENLNTYIVGQYRYPLGQYSWEVPEGGALIPEDPLVAGKRELLEETGLEAKEWTLLMETHLSNSVTDEKGFVFLARDLVQKTASPEHTEQLIVKKIPFSRLVEMADNGEITDAFSLLAIYKVERMLAKGRVN